MIKPIHAGQRVDLSRVKDAYTFDTLDLLAEMYFDELTQICTLYLHVGPDTRQHIINHAGEWRVRISGMWYAVGGIVIYPPINGEVVISVAMTVSGWSVITGYPIVDVEKGVVL